MKITSDYSISRQNYAAPSFKRNWSEHVSWGVNYLKKEGKADFKMFSFPDAKNVFVEIANSASEKFGHIKDRTLKIIGVLGSAFTLKEILPEDEKTRIYPMENKGDGIFEAKGIQASENTPYRFIVVKDDTTVNVVKDPYTKQQPDINGWSEVYDPDNYKWVNTDWLTGKDSRRITRKPNEPFRGLENLIIEEINIPTVTKEGTFESAKKYIDKIAEKGIATAIEIMPVENTYSPQWGYDGVDKMAVNEKLGGPVQLKSLIDYAHGKGLNVIMDMVPNHIGPDGDSLTKAGPYESGAGEFGGELNYEGIDNRYVRDWMTNAALWWANEFKVDGIRFDMTKHCKSDYFLKQIVAEVNEHNPDVFLIAEDGRENFDKVTQYNRFEMTHDNELAMIDQGVDNIAQRRFNSDPGEIGFDSEWDFPFMHDIKDALLTPSPILLGKLDWKIKNSAYRVKYTMSHDEIGNEDGTRFIPKVITRELDLFLKVNGSSDAQKGQRAAKVSQALAELAVSEKLDKMSEEELTEYEKSIGLQEFIPKDKIQTAFEIAIAKQKLGLGTVFTIPGIKMFFQGDDEADLSNFKFFREFSDEKQQREQDYDYARRIIHQKGYDTLFAKDSSMLGRVPENPKYKKIKTSIQNFCSEMTKLLKEHPALRVGDIIETFQDNYNNVHTHHLKKDDEEFLILKNFGQAFHSDSYYYVNFPQGEWKEVLNSDSTKFGGGGFTNEDKVITKNNQGINMAPNSIVILKKI